MTGHPVEALSALLDGELPEAERRDVEAHVAACPSCARHLRELGSLEALARSQPPVSVPDGYLEALPALVRQRVRSARPAGRAAPWLWPLAAGLVLAVLTPLVLREPSSAVPRPEERHAAQALPPPAATPPPQTPAPEPEPPRAGAGLDVVTDRDARRGRAARRETASREPPARALSAPPPPTPVESADAASSAVTMAEGDARGNEAFAAAPPAVPEESKQVEAQSAERGLAVGGVTSAVRKSEGASLPTDEERAFRAAVALPLATAAEARSARQAWRRFVAQYSRSERADEARVRIVEASVAAFRDAASSADREAAERDGAAYLASPEAPQAARVQAALRRLDDPR